MAKHLIDTDLYIDLIQSGGTAPVIRELYEKDAPGIYFSSIVAQELLRAPALRQAKGMSKFCWRPLKRPDGLSRRLIANGKKRVTSWLAS